MALTVEEVFRAPGTERQMHVHKVTFDSSYPTGGEALTAADLDWSDAATNLVVLPLAGGYTLEYDATNAKLLAYWVDTTVDGAKMSEVANTTNLSALIAYVISFGKKPA